MATKTESCTVCQGTGYLGNAVCSTCDGIGSVIEDIATPEALTTERKSTHGDWQVQSTIFDNLLFNLTQSPNWNTMNAMHRASLINIAQKMSRICAGDPDEPDHWDDIGGYALLGKGGHKK